MKNILVVILVILAIFVYNINKSVKDLSETIESSDTIHEPYEVDTVINETEIVKY